MEQKKLDTALEKDKSLVENLFTKEVLANYDLSTSNMPKSYLETFPEKVLHRISNNQPKTFFLTPIGKMAIAAVFLLVIGSTFIFLNNNVSKNPAMNTIAIQDISNEEMEAYVDANEWMAEIDWHSEAFKTDNEIEQIYKDSIN